MAGCVLIIAIAAGVWIAGGAGRTPADRMPSADEARALFIDLHRDIYRAFEHEDEGAIYDALAASVDGALLDRIYAEIYEGLVMREQGGALSRIRSVDMLEVRLVVGPPSPADDPPSFRVRSTWEVMSSLEHEGHEHVRLSEYEGLYTVALGDHGWRIVDDKILRQRRLPTLSPEPAG